MKTENVEDANSSVNILNQCDLCEKFFSTKTNLKRHQSNIHSKQIVDFTKEIKQEQNMVEKAELKYFIE